MPRFRPRVLPVLSLAGLAFAAWFVFSAKRVEPAPPPVQPPRAPYPTTLAAAGVLEPAASRTTSIGTPFASLVVEVSAVVGDRVAKGAPLFRLDDRTLVAQAKVLGAQATVARAGVEAAEAQLRSAEASVVTAKAGQAAAEARLLRLESQPRPEELPPLEARVAEAQAVLDDRDDQVRRYEAAVKAAAGVTSEDDLDRRRFAASVARMTLARAKADLALSKAGAWAPEVAEAKAAVAQAVGAVAQADAAAAKERAAVATARATLEAAQAAIDANQVEVARATVRSPIDATVLDVDVRPGEYAAANREALMVLGDLTTLLVRVDVDEESVPLVRERCAAQAVVRGFPDKPFPLEFVRIEPFVRPKTSLTGATNERVDTRVLQVIFRAGKADLPVYVGQQVDVFMEGVPRAMGPAVPGVMPTK